MRKWDKHDDESSVKFGKGMAIRRGARITHGQLKTYGSCEILDIFQIQFYGWVIGVVVFPMP